VTLLRLIEEKEYHPLGSDAPMRTDARVVCSTLHDLKHLVSTGRFRRDLYYRLSTHTVHIPPLRERPMDFVLLADHFLEETAKALQKNKPTVPPELYTLISTYRFPGNIRELKTTMFDAVARHRSGVLSLGSFKRTMGEHVPAEVDDPSPSGEGTAAFLVGGRFPTLAESEEYLVSEALRRANNNQGIAATLLGITRQALNKRIARRSKPPRQSSW
jgi:transcriptional regulator with PAS, ATPase and Fis domain